MHYNPQLGRVLLHVCHHLVAEMKAGSWNPREWSSRSSYQETAEEQTGKIKRQKSQMETAVLVVKSDTRLTRLRDGGTGKSRSLLSRKHCGCGFPRVVDQQAPPMSGPVSIRSRGHYGRHATVSWRRNLGPHALSACTALGMGGPHCEAEKMSLIQSRRGTSTATPTPTPTL